MEQKKYPWILSYVNFSTRNAPTWYESQISLKDAIRLYSEGFEEEKKESEPKIACRL
jgi:hypothetical protein